MTRFFNLFLFISNLSFSQEINYQLKSKLDSILYSDQVLRELTNSSLSKERKQEIIREFKLDSNQVNRGVWLIINRQDSINLAEVEEIIDKYGYPGKSLVGDTTNEAAFYVIQHSNKIKKQHFNLVKEAGKAGELSLKLVAMMEDRFLMQNKKPQKYGTQIMGYKVDKQDGSKEWLFFIWPLKDSKNIDQLRKSVNIESDLKEYAERLGAEYKFYTIKEIEKIIGYKL